LVNDAYPKPVIAVEPGRFPGSAAHYSVQRARFRIGDGLSIEILIGKCFLARLDLGNDDDVARIEALKASGRTFVTGKQIGWFKRICRELGEIEAYV
jgi:hypothetical protein